MLSFNRYIVYALIISGAFLAGYGIAWKKARTK